MADIHTQTVAELQKKVSENREALRTVRFGGAGSRTRNVRAGRTLRRETARLLTEIRTRELAEKTKNA